MKLLNFLFVLCIITSPVFAQDDSDPIEITADGALEWRRADNMYVAIDNAKVVQSGTTLTADYIEAHYAEGGDSSSITKIVATGNNLKLDSEDITVTAKDSLEYYSDENKFVAKGNAWAKQGEDTIEADTLTAWFKDGGKEGEGEEKAQGLDRALAEGNVVITTPKENATGNRATYNTDTSIAELTGNVKIYQDENMLEGARATVNTKTGISQLFAGSETGKVKGIFYPGKKKEQ